MSFLPKVLTLAVVVVSSVATSSTDARADVDSNDLSPAPLVLPRLSHPSTDLGIDGFLGRLVPAGSARSGRSASAALIARPSFELSALVPRTLYFGATLPVAVALPPDGGLAPLELGRPSGTQTMLGNVEGHLRAVFALPSASASRGGLEIGFGLGLVVPTATFDRSDHPNRSAAEAAASVDPTSYAQYLPQRVAFRPSGDVRIVRGTFVFQGRHGIDVIIDADGKDSVQAAGRLLGHVGWLARNDLELSFEASQMYFFTGSTAATANQSNPDAAFDERYRINDQHRSAITIGPGIRLALPQFDIGTSLITNLRDPLSPAAAGFVALRVSVIAHLGR